MENKIKNIFVAGGTTGMGKGIAMHYLRLGSKVIIVGNTHARGQQLLDEAALMGAADRLTFIRADLTSVRENRRVIEEVKSKYQSLDAVILTAMMPFPKRKETEDGFESTFSLYYVSRFILSYGLTSLLEKSENPLIVSLGGTGVINGEIHWDDLSLRNKYKLLTAMKQGNRANDLQGIAYTENHKNSKIRFILNHPGYTNSGVGHVKQPLKIIMKIMGSFFAQPVEKSILPIIKLMDNPPNHSLIAWDRTKPIELYNAINISDAQRLYELTKNLVADFV
ncbi:short chain dehydrogenase [compost metagenome]